MGSRAIRQGSLDKAACGRQEVLSLLGAGGGAAWGDGGGPGRPQPLAFLSLQPAGTSLHRSQCPRGVETAHCR